MRQAGRYLAEYQEIRAGHSILEVCKTPELAVEVTLQPIRRFDLDAAIIFADILLPLEPMGLSLEFAAGEGPVIANPIRTAADVAALGAVRPDADLGFVLESIRQARAALAGEVPLIGFAGAPFTLASYAIEGGASRNYIETKRLMYGDPDAWHDLMGRLSDAVAEFLAAQVAAGAQAVQLFDSWVGALSPDDYAEYASPYSQRIFSALAELGVPRIHFGTGANTLLPLMAGAGCDVIGLDWRIPLDEGWAVAGHDLAVQGNLDPTLVFAPDDVVARKVREVLEQGKAAEGHVFNLGHGVLPETDPDALLRVVERVHAGLQG